MKRWLSFIGIIATVAGFGLFTEKIDTCSLESEEQNELKKRAHPFLRTEKIALHQATVRDFDLVLGISLTTAREIYDRVQRGEVSSMRDLLAIKGIGEKTLAKLQAYFY